MTHSDRKTFVHGFDPGVKTGSVPRCREKQPIERQEVKIQLSDL